ncbi:MAG: LysM peptidoglycan-binding domain-containing protein [Bacteroidales bacterium]
MNRTISIITSIIFFSMILSISSCTFFKNLTKGPEARQLKADTDEEPEDRMRNEEPFVTDAEIVPAWKIENPPDGDSDSVAYVESLTFEDTLLMTYNEQMNQEETAQEIIEGSPVIKILDSLVNVKFFNDDRFITNPDELNGYGYALDYVPSFSDSVYEARLAKLNALTPIELTYNQTVKNFIEVYAVRKRELTSRLLGLAEIYFPMFEEILDQYDIPFEFKYLAVVESALIPNAGSHAGAKGLWQFMYRTGKVYGLKVNSYVDDRYDPYKSTVAACQHLRDLYDIYNDWSLAMAAYNSGAGNVNKAIRRAGGIRNYWAIWPFLPRETRGYVPAFIAVNYVMNFATDHNLYPVDPGILYNGIDTIHVTRPLSFDQVSEFLDIPMRDLQFLNPSFKEGIIPAGSGDIYVLRLPREYASEFASNEKEIYAFKSQKQLERDKLLDQIEQAKQRDIHYVRSGETLGHIARRYHTSVSNLRAWNNLRGSTIYPGQKLVVYASPGSTSRINSSSSSIKRDDEQSVHLVKSGENLGLIAKKYKCSTTDLMQWNNLKSSTIYPHQKLIVYKPVDSKTKVVKTSDGKVKYIYHVVKRGDTLWDIAKQYDGVTVNQIKRLNNLTNSHRIKPGQRLKIAVVS